METVPLTYFWAIILGVVQGLTEFLPVSSSGHLALVEHLGMGMPEDALFDVLLHVATLLAVLLFFAKAVLWYFKNDKIVLFYVLIATIPTAVIGYLAKDYFEALRHSPTMICIGLLVTAMALSVAELGRGATYQLRDLGWFGAFFVGLCQALAITPGISRSGATISGAILCGIDKEEAFRFSFILSVPAILGAMILHGYKIHVEGGLEKITASMPLGPVLSGLAAAFIVGYISLLLLRKVVVNGKLVWFAAYCCLAAIAGLIYFNI